MKYRKRVGSRNFSSSWGMAEIDKSSLSADANLIRGWKKEEKFSC